MRNAVFMFVCFALCAANAALAQTPTTAAAVTVHQGVSNPASCCFGNEEFVLHNVPVNAAYLNVYNVLGQRVLEQNIAAQPGSQRFAFAVSENGLYFVELRDENKNVLTVIKAVKR